ncbi:MAG: YggS family pyridoxal phosphate-dependent enzyme [Methylacidiphilales bacterium]|nr:YggS family pyridoxal phosphate-dependent enzyme [Candidatus Methylacidiphilales bacterium]
MNDYSYETIKHRVASIRENSRSHAVTIIAVTKKHPWDVLPILYSLGINDFGENYAQELALKRKELIDNNHLLENAVWYYQGVIQKNKINMIVKSAAVILSFFDRAHLPLIQKACEKFNKTINCCIQVKLQSDSNRNGIVGSHATLQELVTYMGNFPNIQYSGIMTTLPLHLSALDQEKYFAQVSNYYNSLPKAPMLSMGMSDDYTLAIKHGATHVRIGTALLGKR